MTTYRRTTTFGWKGDRGVGERLIRQIIRGDKTATACPKVLYSPAEIKDLHGSVGHRLTVLDKIGRPRCAILRTAVFETRFGDPDPRLVRGEGYADAAGFKEAHRHIWDDLLKQARAKLTDDTVLVAEVFRLIDCCQKAHIVIS